MKGKTATKESKLAKKELEAQAKELELTNQKLADYTATLQQLQADFQNHLKRTEKEKQDLTNYGSAKVLLKVLNILDDFDRALALGENASKEELLSGLEMVRKEAGKILAEEGVTAMEALGQEADPYRHEVIDFIISDKEEGVILEELQKGYMIKDKVLRTSKVRVAKKE